jgi:preprotein translocase subunit SecF
MFAINHKTKFYILSIVLTVIALLALFFYGLKPGIDFTGGSVLEISFPNQKPAQEQIEKAVSDLNLGNSVVRSAGENGYLIKTPSIDDASKKTLLNSISQNGLIEFKEEKFITVGPVLGEELTSKSFVSVGLVLLAITLYVAYVFRVVSTPVSSWKYGFATIIALIHDVIITVGFFAIAGKFFGIEVDTFFVIAILVVLGYSVNDSIVVLDRVREKLQEIREEQRLSQFKELVGKSLVETIARSLNTTITTLLSLIALYIWGGEATKTFALALIVGITAGAYSSIFIAPQLLVTFFERGKTSLKK